MNPDIMSANEILDSWGEETHRRAVQNLASDADLEYALSRSVIHIDAGFEEPDYIKEVANDWLDQDVQKAKGAGLTAIAERIQSKIDEINASLAG